MAKSNDAALAKLQVKIEAEQTKYRLAVRSAIENTLGECGLTLADLVDSKPIGRGSAPVDEKRAAKKAPAEAVKTRKAPFKGKQPPKYRDPKTGATWSGMGRAPAWIASAKSRDRFLIVE